MSNFTVPVLSTSDSSIIKNLKANGNYADAYRYLANLFRNNPTSDPRIASWLDIAAQVNEGGNAWSDLVRGVTMAGGDLGCKPITNAKFQEESDKLADSLLNDFLTGKVPNYEYIIARDVEAAVEGLGLPTYLWAGILGAPLPPLIGGLGLDGQTWGELLAGKDGSIAQNLLIALTAMALGSTDAMDGLITDLAVQLGVDPGLLSSAASSVFDVLGGSVALGYDLFKGFANYANGSGIFCEKISNKVNGTFSAAETWHPVDPLAFDLDGDGIETLAENGNAANGFEALADFDTNADGVVDVNDANFAGLRVWQDINSDGISQANELLTLTQAGVASINR